MQTQRQQIVELECVIYHELDTSEIHEHFPMTVSHRRMAQICHKRDGGHKVFNICLTNGVSIGLLDKLVEATELFVYTLCTVFNHFAINIVPQRLVPIIHRIINHVHKMPHLEHLCNVHFQTVLNLLGCVHELGKFKYSGEVS